MRGEKEGKKKEKGQRPKALGGEGMQRGGEEDKSKKGERGGGCYKRSKRERYKYRRNERISED